MFDLGVKKVKVNLMSLFEQSWYYSSTQCHISSFKAIGTLVPIPFDEIVEIVIL